MTCPWLVLLAGLAALPCDAQARRDSTRASADSVPSQRPRFELPELRTTIRSTPALYLTRSIEPEASRLGDALGEWLRGLAGVQVRARGEGGAEQLSIRGSRPEAVRVTLDGIPLNDPLTGAADLSLIAAGSIETATLTAGSGAAAGWGGTAGVLRLSSRQSEPGVRLRGLAGSYGKRSTELEASWQAPEATVSLFGRVEGARNDYSFANRIHPDRPEEVRRNADTGAWHVLGHVGLEALPVTVVVRADGVERGAPGRMGNHLWDEARWRERRTSIAGSWKPAVSLGASVGWSRSEQTYADGRVDRRDDVAAQQLETTGSAVGPGGLAIEWTGAWAEVRGDRIGSRTRWTGGVRTHRETSLGRVLRLHSAVGVDAAEEGVAVSPSLGLSLSLGEAVRLHARASQARRLPSFADLYLRPGAGVLPNPDLRPERVTLDSELGFEWTDDRLSIRADAFRRQTRDPIIWLPSVIAVWAPRNLGRLRAMGVEAAILARPWDQWRFDATATWQTSRVTFENQATNALPYEPRISGSLSARYVGPGRVAAATLSIVGRRNTNLFGPHDLPPYALLNIRGRQTFYLLGLKVEAELGIVNVFDARYERIELFPEPGRRFEIGLSLATGGRANLQRATSGQSFPNAADDDGRGSE